MSRPKSIVLSVPSLDARIEADLDWSVNPSLCEALCSSLPFSTIFSHVMASGECIYSPARVVGVFDTKQVLLTEIPVGSILLGTSNYKEFSVMYGEMTEPLPVPVPIAYVRSEHLGELKRVGREVWQSTYMSKKLIQLDVSVATN